MWAWYRSYFRFRWKQTQWLAQSHSLKPCRFGRYAAWKHTAVFQRGPCVLAAPLPAQAVQRKWLGFTAMVSFSKSSVDILIFDPEEWKLHETIKGLQTSMFWYLQWKLEFDKKYILPSKTKNAQTTLAEKWTLASVFWSKCWVSYY